MSHPASHKTNSTAEKMNSHFTTNPSPNRIAMSNSSSNTTSAPPYMGGRPTLLGTAQGIPGPPGTEHRPPAEQPRAPTSCSPVQQPPEAAGKPDRDEEAPHRVAPLLPAQIRVGGPAIGASSDSRHQGPPGHDQRSQYAKHDE